MSISPLGWDAKFDPLEFENHLVSRGAVHPCPLCEHDEWVKGLFPGGILRVTERTLDDERGYRVAVRSCSNCGYVQLFSLDPFERRSG